MSSNGILDTPKVSRKQVHWTNHSGEIDVFEAARYFSDLNEISGYNATKLSFQKPWRGGRMSFDMPTIRETLYYNTSLAHGPGVLNTGRDTFPSQAHSRESQKEKKYKQPSSPGGRLASFLNSLFSHRSSKKKKSKSTTTESIKDEDDQTLGGATRRRRRSSISHFRIPSMVPDPKPVSNPGSGGFRTPPPYAYTPTKSHKDLFPQVNENLKSDEKSRFGHGKSSERYKNMTTNTTRFEENRRTSWADQYLSDEKEFRKIFKEVDEDNHDDDGGESDSSSDLFELPNFDYSSSGLPVYESTNVDTIKKGAPVSNITR